MDEGGFEGGGGNQLDKLIIMTTAEYIQIGILIVMGLGVIAALLASRKQTLLMRQQMKVNLFADYTKRYQEIILHFPENINDKKFDFDELKRGDHDLYNKTMRYMRTYFDLCSEEFYLNKNSQIDKAVWREWSQGIKYTFTKKAFKQAWEIATKNSKFYDDFANWMKEEVLNQ